MVSKGATLSPNLTARTLAGSMPGASRAPVVGHATKLLDMIAGAWVSQALYVVAELAIADLLADGPKTAEELANATGAHPEALSRVLRALATLDVFGLDRSGRFTHTPLSRCLESDRPDSLRPLALMRGTAWFWETWGQFLYSVQTGKPAFNRAHGSPFFDYIDTHSEAAHLFHEAMTRRSATIARAVVVAYDFSPLTRLVDVGGGHGVLLSAILRATPHLHGVLFDLPQVIADARHSSVLAKVNDRCTRVAGDFFVSIPRGADGYVLNSVLHDWPDERSVAILQRCRQAMEAGARLLVIDLVLPLKTGSVYGNLLDLSMLTLFGGQERTGGEHRALLAAAGFHLTRIIPTECDVSVIEAVAA
jgi:hypothetical protein